jgi:hypothetical protein
MDQEREDYRESGGPPPRPLQWLWEPVVVLLVVAVVLVVALYQWVREPTP